MAILAASSKKLQVSDLMMFGRVCLRELWQVGRECPREPISIVTSDAFLLVSSISLKSCW